MSVTLRELRDADLDALFVWEGNEAAISMAAFTRPDPEDRAAFDDHYRRVRTDPEILNLAIDDDGEFAGLIASFTLDGDREVTYWVDPQRWGRGIASAALKAFCQIETRRPLHARVAAHNRGSIAVLENNGFTRTGEETSWADGAGRDVLEYLYLLG